MNIKKHINLLTIGLILTIFSTGCAGYGKLGSQSRLDNRVTIQDLIDRSDDFHIYYSGYAENNSSGILFDLKNDDKALTPSRQWVKIEDKEAVSNVVDWIQIYDYPAYEPTLRRIVDPDDQFYGYLFTGWNYAVFKVVDAKTLFVYGLPDPPHYCGPFERFKEKS